ncbi:MAG: lytic transglycosylase domain-containing protein [Clostridia bacterium]|nr:lytic transglycosylase domain-containing protein [Clostridia bacterium]
MKKKILIILGIIVGFIVVYLLFQHVVLKMIYPKKYSEYVYKYSQENEVDPLLVFAIIKAESDFKSDALSKSGAIGLMQLMPETAEEILNEIGIELKYDDELYDEEKNIKVGTKYYAFLNEKYNGKIELALAAYNAGIGNVNKWIEEGIISKDGSNIENIPYKETNNYVRKILRDYAIYRNLYKEK